MTSSSLDEPQPADAQLPVAMLEARLRCEGAQLMALQEQISAAKANAYATVRLAWPRLTEQRIAQLLGVDRMTVRRALGKMPSRAQRPLSDRHSGRMPEMTE